MINVLIKYLLIHYNFLLQDTYNRTLKHNGFTPCGVCWNSKKSQYIRFDVLTSLLKKFSFNTRLKIADVGCGYAELLNYFSEHNMVFEYFFTIVLCLLPFSLHPLHPCQELTFRQHRNKQNKYFIDLILHYEAFLKSFFQFDKLAFERFRNSRLFLAKSLVLYMRRAEYSLNPFPNEKSVYSFLCCTVFFPAIFYILYS